MATKFKTICAVAGLIAAFGFASPAAFACSGKWSSASAGGNEILAQRTNSGSDQNSIQNQTDPSRNGAIQSEDPNGANKNGQPQR